MPVPEHPGALDETQAGRSPTSLHVVEATEEGQLACTSSSTRCRIIASARMAVSITTASLPEPWIFELHGDEVGCGSSVADGDPVKGVVQGACRLSIPDRRNQALRGPARRRPDRGRCGCRCASAAHRQCRRTSPRVTGRSATTRRRPVRATLRRCRASARCRAAPVSRRRPCCGLLSTQTGA